MLTPVIFQMVRTTLHIGRSKQLPLEKNTVIPSYSLCPTLNIAGILLEMTAALEYAGAKIAGNIHLCGHSAGGHLVTHLITRNSPLNSSTISRIAKTLSISGLYDLRPLLNTKMRKTLQLNKQSALALSPALTSPAPEQSVTCWVGEKERPEFIRQSALLPMLWQSFDTHTASCIEKNKHHFNVTDGLTDACCGCPTSAICSLLDVVIWNDQTPTSSIAHLESLGHPLYDPVSG